MGAHSAAAVDSPPPAIYRRRLSLRRPSLPANGTVKRDRGELKSTAAKACRPAGQDSRREQGIIKNKASTSVKREHERGAV